MDSTPTPFDSDAPVGARRAIIRRNPYDLQEVEMVEATWGSNPRFSGGVEYRFVRSEGQTFPSHRCLIPASEFHMQVGKKTRRAVLVIDEGDSIAAARTQEHSHHEDKVAVNTLIQGIDDLRRYKGRIVVILCTNRLSVLDPALLRRAAIVDRFDRPSDAERRALLEMDLDGLDLTPAQIGELVKLTGPTQAKPGWTYSDFRTRFYPAAMAKAFPDGPLRYEHLRAAATEVAGSRVMEDR